MNDRGYCIVSSFIGKREKQEIKKYIEKSEKWQGDLFEMDNIFGKILNNDNLKQILQSCIGESHLATYCIHNLGPVENEDRCVSDWHVDYPIHDMKEPYPDKCQAIEGILALDTFTLENGATHIAPGSHISQAWPRNVEKSDFNTTRVLLKAGDLLLFDSRLWHKAGENNTSRFRSALVFNFANMDTEPKDDISISRGCGFKKINNRITFN